ncbi:SDR family NAD(P)-dependent oxidoreductase [Legionella bozemanae]|uniref:SDR family NAD(P)-dependent oxidoreductase n=1 Tax=Legionella bozemanae TaxID=447 RepID=UPI00104158AC|nr:SDR family NAD(P)-dependent oxidoreductase [Legionella bozemanae]
MIKKNSGDNLSDIMHEPLAIVGINCQFPGVNADIEDVDAFYEMLIKEQTSIKEVPANRWDIDRYYDTDRQKDDKIVSRKGGFLNDPQLFDAAFFEIAPIEAKQIDPQHRLFLEVAIRALNHANIPLDSLKYSNTAVYCGISTNDYNQLNYKDNIKFNAYTYIGSADSAAAGRLSYFLNLKGPCITVDTACSSSLSALYLATTALRNQQCDMAIVGGVHLSLCPEIFIGVTKANMLSALGQCSSFDAKADGYARSEGCGVMVVKRLCDAIKDDNQIHAVIKSIVMNQDGGGMGMAAPNIEAQIAMHQSVLEQAHLAASDIDYIETHGTGTVVGDSVEFNAIQHIHQGQHDNDKPLIIGALKSNLGHTISSSGIASLIKVIEAFKHETIPANLHYATPNSSIDPKSIPALIPVKAIPFTKQLNKKRYAQVSNFGFTGTNVSAIIEEPPSFTSKEPIADNGEPVCFVFSANSEYSLQHMMVSYLHYFKESSASLRDVCYTLLNCRDHYKFRCAIIAKDKRELIKAIESKDYELKRVTIKEDIKITGNDANQIFKLYLSGANIRLDERDNQYNKVDLPLYYFDRKPYWHEPRSSSISEQSSINAPQKAADDAIAIIGMSCSLPNAPDITAFERLLEEGLSGIKDIPIDRWDNEKYYNPNKDVPGKSYVNKLGLIENIKDFDASFFGISPREAQFMEPQHRIFLECCYLAMENANYPPSSLRDSLTGVFVGVGPIGTGYYPHQNETLNFYYVTGNGLSYIPGRVAYVFDFKGPSIGFSTTCSSSLVAIHYACQSLKNKEIDFALAGGVNIILMPELNIALCNAKALSPDGQCKTFDAGADGYVRSEGCGVIFLKRLADAVRDKDTVLAIIKASAVNHDGKSMGFTTPNGKSQEEVMLQALKQTKLSSSDISYVETHGTGTPIGDPIEVHSINNVYGCQRSKDNPLYLGAVKTNIGHLESASGIAGVIKTIISLQKKKIYKNLNFKKLNPNIKLDNTRIALQNMDWNMGSKPNCAGVNSFGFSGTNAHLILQEFAVKADQSPPQPARLNLLVISAKTQTSLDHLAKRYQQYLETTKDSFSDVCFTAATCREHHPYRLAVVAKSAAEAGRLLDMGQFASSQGKNNPFDLQDDAVLMLLLTDYLQGKNVDWNLYYKNCDHRFIKVALPNYAFDRKEFWFEKRDSLISTDIVQASPISGNESHLNHLYEIIWNKLNVNLLSTPDIPDFWVIAQDEMKVKQVFGHLAYQRTDDVNALESIENKNIIFFYEEGQFTALFHCCQKMFKSCPSSFILVTENAYSINGKNKVNPEHTMASAFWKSFRNELGLSRNYTIDLGSNGNLNKLLNYLFDAKNLETQFAVRDSIYVPRLEKKQLPPSPEQQKTLFDREASYLITGGTGGLGKALIEYLILRGARHIIITSRSECSMDTKDLISSARKKQVYIRHYAADASNYQQMKQIFESIEQDSKPLRGVFHLAGVIKDGLIVNLRDEDVQTVLRAKMESAQILHQLTKNIQLDVFVLFSSIASVLGSKGQSNYVAANGFLDGLAHLRHQLGLPAIAINWGPFHTVGMAANLTQAMKQQGLIPLDKDSVDILDVLLTHQVTQIAVCPIDRDIYCKNAPKQMEFFAQSREAPAPAQHFLNALREHAHEERVAMLSLALCKITADVMGMPELDQTAVKDDLYSMGMDSLMYLEIRNRMHDKLQCPSLSIPIEYFFNHPSIDKIARNLANELQNIFAKETGNHAQSIEIPEPDKHFLNALREHAHEERVAMLSSALCKITADVMGMPELDQTAAKDDLYSMGLDSLMYLEIRNRMHDKLQCPALSIPIEYFINHPSIDKIARNLADELQNIFAKETGNHVAKNPVLEEIALSDYQYIYWVLNKLGYAMNCGIHIQIHGKLNKEYLFQAFDFVVKQNSVFWINFNKDAPTQMLKKEGQFQLNYEDISLDNKRDVLKHEFYSNVRSIIPLNRQPLIRVCLYKVHHDLHELHIVMPHIISDDDTCNIVLAQLKKNYTALTRGETLTPIPEKASFFDYVRQSNIDYAKNLKDKIDFWWSYNKGVKGLNFGPGNHLPHSGFGRSKHLFHYTIESQFVEKFIDWYKEKNISISSGLIAACQIVFYKISQQNKIPVTLIHQGREGSQYKSALGLFSERKRINSTLNVEDSYIGSIHSIEEQLLKTAPYQKCSQLIKNQRLRGFSLSLGQYLRYAFNKAFLTKHFKKSKLNSIVIDYYLSYLAQLTSRRKNILIKSKLNKIFNLNIPLLKPSPVNVCINITEGFFKEPPHMKFADLDYNYASHFASVDRPIGNQYLWIIFTRNQDGKYLVSINGPLTEKCNDQIASELIKLIKKLVKNDEAKIADLISD